MLRQTSMGVDKSISKMSDQRSKQLNPQEVGSLVQNQTRTEEAPGNSWRDHLQRFKMLDPDEQFRTICESVGFIRPASVGMYYRTSNDTNGGFGNLTASCREYTQPRAHQDSVVTLWVKRSSEIGPVLEVKIFCHLDVHGIEIQIPSTSGDNTNVWVVIFRGGRVNDQCRANTKWHNFLRMPTTHQQCEGALLDVSCSFCNGPSPLLRNFLHSSTAARPI